MLQGPLQRQQLQLVAGGAQGKPAQQQQPEATKGACAQEQEHPKHHAHPTQQLAAACGRAHALLAAATGLPDQGFNDLPAIEGQPRQQVEQRQQQIELGQHQGHFPQGRLNVAQRMHGHRQQEGQERTHRRASGRHQQGAHRCGGIPLNGGHPAQHEQGDAAHLHAKAQRHQRMAEFVQHHGEKQQQRCEESVGRIAIKLLAKQHRGQHQDKQPTGMDIERNSGQAHHLPALALWGVAHLLAPSPQPPS